MNAANNSTAPDAPGVLARIQSRLDALNISERGASLKAFGHPSAIRNIRNGATKDPGINTLSKLAPVLETTPEWLAYGAGQDRPAAVMDYNTALFLPVTGEVAAGQWLEQDQTLDHPIYDAVPVPVDPRWPRDAQYCLITRGTSINRHARDGDLLACVDAVSTGYSARDGELVIVERRRNGGGWVERTAKIFKRTAGRFELWPDSDDPRWQEPIVIDPEDADEETEIAVVAFVAWVHRCLTPTVTKRQT